MTLPHGHLLPAHTSSLYQAFVNAFSNYFVQFHPSRSQFEQRLFYKLNVRLDLSGAVFDQGNVVAFVLHSLGTHQGLLTAYNGGTGVVPAFRQQGLGQSLYRFLLPTLMEAGAQRVLLEVIRENHVAQQLYQGLGFQPQRELRCFALRTSLIKDNMPTVPVRQTYQLPANIRAIRSFEPTFMDSDGQLPHNLAAETILEAVESETTIGYIIFQHEIGRISQLAVQAEHRQRGIGRLLVSKAQQLSRTHQLTIMNIPETETDTLSALERIGFVNEVNQVEMELRL